MTFLSDTATVTWGIAALATSGVIIRPWRLPEGVWAVLGALTLVLLGLLPWRDALNGIRNGVDVYLFLIGMMLLAELARREGLFDWLAAVAVDHARGSPQRLFTLIYVVGVLVTVFLSNDATAVVLTPAVYAAARSAGAEPLPYLFICAFIANAASFVCQCRTLPTLLFSALECRRSCRGLASLRCRPFCRSAPPTLLCVCVFGAKLTLKSWPQKSTGRG